MIKKNQRRPTIADVARLANVSTATVSRALQTPELVSQKTRKTVFDIVAKTGYRPNTAAKILRQNRAQTLLVILPNIANPFFSEILSGIEDVATEHKFTILIGNANEDESRTKELLANLRNGRADGALLLNGTLPMAADELADLALVSISEKITSARVPHVGTDSIAASRDATTHLIGLGHKRIVHLRGPTGNILTSERQEGYEQAMKAAGLEAFIKVLACGFGLEDGKSAAEALTKSGPLPDALVCASDVAAMGAISELLRRGVNVPDDLSVVGFDDISFADIFSPPLTTIRQERREIGRLATRMLLGILQGTFDGEDKVVGHNIIQRASSKPRNGNTID